jgi:hypothetical protein
MAVDRLFKKVHIPIVWVVHIGVGNHRDGTFTRIRHPVTSVASSSLIGMGQDAGDYPQNAVKQIATRPSRCHF